MEAFSWSTIVCLSLIFVLGSICGETQDIGMTFTLMDPSRHEVVFVGQTGVTLICEVTNVPPANITIINPDGETVASNDARGTLVEYVIAPAVMASDGGDYRCNVQYLEGPTLCRALNVNVQSGGQGCVRDGTPGTAFQVGDTLSLTCYCYAIEKECKWIETEVDSLSGKQLAPVPTVVGNLTILRVTVGPIREEDLKFRFDCTYGESIEERCSVGPANVSANEYVLRPEAVSCSEITTTTPLTTDTGGVTTAGDSPGAGGVDGGSNQVTTKGYAQDSGGIDVVDNNNDLDGDPGGDGGGFLIYIIIAGAVLLLVCILVALIILATRMKRNGKVKTVDESRVTDLDPDHDPSRKSSGYDPPGGENLGYDASDYATVYKKPMPAVRARVHDDSDDQGVGNDDDDQFRVSAVIDDTNPRMSVIAEINQQLAVRGDCVRETYKISENVVDGYGMDPRESSQYGTVASDQINEAEEFVSADVVEYGVPRAFTSSTYGDEI